MFNLFSKRFRIIALLVLVLVLGAATYGFAADNTVPTSYAGEGEGLIDGYTVSGIQYTLDATDPNEFDGVSFTLDQSATTLRVGISVSGTPTWLPAGDCTVTGGVNVSCDLTGFAVDTAVGLIVAAAQ
jgi:hypothetical protein